MSADPVTLSTTGDETVRRIQEALWKRSGLQPSEALSLRSALRELVRTADLAGLKDVRLLPRDRRVNLRPPKVFFLLETHDLKRDRRIIELMSQLEDVDYDLVPASSSGMIPDGAESVLG